jgi:cell division protein ZapA (FtsZ GTPase activity inhibitor)
LASNRKVYEVRIAGIVFNLKTSQDENTVYELVNFVNTKIEESTSALKSGSLQNAAILASLNIAEDYLMLKKQAVTELDRLEQKVRKVSSELESSQITS